MPSMDHSIRASQMPRVLRWSRTDDALGREGFMLNPRKGKLGRIYIDIRKDGKLIASHKINRRKVGWHYTYSDREYFSVFFIPQLLDTAKIGLMTGAETYEID